jgi:hypothetical protein
MIRNLGRSLGIAMMVFVSVGASAHAQTWVPISMPTIEGWGGAVLNTVAPYALGYPPCVDACSSHYESADETSVKGFRIRGDVIALGTGTNLKNQVSAFFSDNAAYEGNEYGLVVYLPTNEVHFYQCGAPCNTGTNWNDVAVWGTPQEYYEYEVLVNSEGNFTFEVVSTVSPYPVIYTQTIMKENWLPNLYDMPGYLTINAAHNVNDGGSWVGSTLHVDEIDMWQ